MNISSAGKPVVAQLWIEEQDKAVWHLANGRTGRLRYTVVCGWVLPARPTRIWPQKHTEIGPPQEQRCHTCIGDTASAARESG